MQSWGQECLRISCSVSDECLCARLLCSWSVSGRGECVCLTREVVRRRACCSVWLGTPCLPCYDGDVVTDSLIGTVWLHTTKEQQQEGSSSKVAAAR